MLLVHRETARSKEGYVVQRSAGVTHLDHAQDNTHRILDLDLGRNPRLLDYTGSNR